MSVRITCINKDGGFHENPYGAISYLGWQNEESGESGRSTREQMYDFVTRNGHAYVQAGQSSLITAISSRGTRYVKTEANSTDTDNLLKLAECR